MGELTKEEFDKREKLKFSKPRVYEKVLRYDEKVVGGESIAIIQWHIKYTCPFRCQHCSISKFRQKKERDFSLEDIKEISRQADELGLAHIDVTGGDCGAFKDLDQIIESIDPAKFYLQCDTAGWTMTKEMAKHWFELKIDKVQLSIDSLNFKEHDDFRRKSGAWERAVKAIDYIKDAGLNLQVATVVSHQRVRSEEFVQFLEFMKERNVAVSMLWPKLVGEWENRKDLVITTEDVAYVNELSKRYNLYHHGTSKYGRPGGCIAVKRMVSLLKGGEITPCPWFYVSLGNVYNTPLKNILEKGMRYFGKGSSKCLVSEDKEFIDKYVSKTWDRDDLPIPIEEIMGDLTDEQKNA